MTELQFNPWKYKLKGVDPPHYHFEGDFFQVSNCTHCSSTNTYVNWLIANYQRLFDEETPENIHTPKYPHRAICFRTGVPNHESKFGEHPTKYNWMHSVYGESKERIPQSLPLPKQKPVRATTWIDATLIHDTVTHQSATGSLHMINQTPIDWLSNRQGQFETATYGSEFVATSAAIEQIMDLQFALCSFGDPLDRPAWLFGNSQAIIASSYSQLSKHWNALTSHQVREAIAAGFRFHHYHMKQNSSYALPKPLDRDSNWPCIDPSPFWKGIPCSPKPRGVSEFRLSTWSNRVMDKCIRGIS